MKRLTAGGDADKSKRDSKEMEKPPLKEDLALPRRSAVIRRTLPEDDVEKTELRFVVYKKPSGKLDKQAFFDEISFFLREQAADMAFDNQNGGGDQAVGSTVEEPTKTPTTESKATTPSSAPASTRTATATSTKTASSGKPHSSLSEASMEAMSADHHNKKCSDAEAIKKALPLLEELVGYFRTLEKSSGRKDVGAMRETSEQVLCDAQQTLTKGGAIGKGLVGRVKALNELATKTRNSTHAKAKKAT